MSKLTESHLGRTAAIYIRQSTCHQLRNNNESRRIQYNLADYALNLGFKSIIRIDEDLGKSGSGTAKRDGFEKLLTAI